MLQSMVAAFANDIEVELFIGEAKYSVCETYQLFAICDFMRISVTLMHNSSILV